MKKEIVEYLGFEDNSKNPVGRPKLADKKTKKKSLIIASISFTFVILLLIFGYGTLFGLLVHCFCSVGCSCVLPHSYMSSHISAIGWCACHSIS